MPTHPFITRAAVGAAVAATAALVTLGAPAADAAVGVVVWTGPSGDTPIPFPADDQCFATPGATGAHNYSIADAFVFTDASCTTGQEAGSFSAFKDFDGAFESVRVRTPAS
ncbi:hypothetical protein [Sporichthya sp.]|uniref:hypothetical protein n=1 Tax=Sporichthya sp. TaxID=65475 RepID=UPI0017FC4456|nr:hypothetical protein [Sporichthya sp.]MBA3742627.1 hypothetical protein [Sporichthya sp.]